MIPTLQEAVDFLRNQRCDNIEVKHTTYKETTHLEVSGYNQEKKYIIYVKQKENGN